nr:MAG TPA: hypothetical protein [Caudoviricetes sp.]
MTQEERSSILGYIAQLRSHCEGASSDISNKVITNVMRLDDQSSIMFEATRHELEEDVYSVSEGLEDMDRVIGEFEDFVNSIDCSEEEDNWEVYGTER